MNINYNISKIEEYLKEIEDNYYHGMLCDPPYALTSIKKRYGSKPPSWGKEGEKGSFGRLGAGFMGQAWDSEIPQTAVWAELLRVSRPGAFLMAWGGARTQHRLICNIEDAGWEIKTSLIHLYGSGFPKAQQIKIDGWENYKTPQLKPAHEIIVLAQKAVEKTYVNNCQKWGCGALNIGGCRVGDEVINAHNAPSGTFAGGEPDRGSDTSSYKNHKGRYPSDVLLQQCPVCELNKTQSGSGKPYGGVARYFKQFMYCKKASKKERNAGCGELEVKDTDNRTDTGKGSFAEKGIAPQRNNHPCVKPIDVNEWLAKLILPPKDGKILIPFSGSGSEALGAMKAGWEHIDLVEMSEEYMEIAKKRIEYWRNNVN